MKKLNAMAVAAALMSFAAFGPAAAPEARVAGEKLDSGLGALGATYTAAEYMYPGWVRGESIDSGLGSLPPTYTAAEFRTPVALARGR